MAEQVHLSHAFGLAPEKAIRYFESKKLKVSFDFWEVWQEEHAKAFTVAKVTRLDILQDIHDAVKKALQDGTTLAQFKRDLTPLLKAKGWWGKQKVIAPDGKEREVMLGSPWRLRNIYRTNLSTSMAAGHWKTFVQNADLRPYLELVNVRDAKLRPSHRLIAGRVFPVSDPIWKKFAPPIDWGCRCRLRSHTKEGAEKRGLKIDSSEGRLQESLGMVSEATGEMRPITTYTDPKTGQSVSTGPGWDYNPGEAGFEPDLEKYAPALGDAYQEEVRRKGLAVRYPVKTNGDIGKLLAAFDKENPGIMKMGFKELRVVNTKSCLMSTTRAGRITVSSATFHVGIKPAAHLRSALGKIAEGKALDFNEEYSVESLWHEIGHTRSKGWMPDWILGEHGLNVMETLNQFVARHTYPEFMELLGGKPSHHQAIIENGYGYSSMVRNFRAILKKVGADEKTALGLLKPLAFDHVWSDIPVLIPKKLAGLMADPALEDKIRRALWYITADTEEAFERVLKKSFGEEA